MVTWGRAGFKLNLRSAQRSRLDWGARAELVLESRGKRAGGSLQSASLMNLGLAESPEAQLALETVIQVGPRVVPTLSRAGHTSLA